jgi:hypothetical protein
VRQVLATTNRSLLESARLALAAEGIDTVVTNDNAALPFTPLTLAVVQDEDFDRAVAIVGALEPATTVPPRASRVRRYSWFILLLLFGAILCFCEPLF